MVTIRGGYGRTLTQKRRVAGDHWTTTRPLLENSTRIRSADVPRRGYKLGNSLVRRLQSLVGGVEDGGQQLATYLADPEFPEATISHARATAYDGELFVFHILTEMIGRHSSLSQSFSNLLANL